MKNRCYKQAQMKHQLFQMRNAKKKNPRWKLTHDQVDYILRIGFPVVPYLYRITTKPIVDVRNQCGLLKEVHYSHLKEHKKYIYKALSHKQKSVLRLHGVEVEEYKYEVLLDQYAGKR